MENNSLRGFLTVNVDGKEYPALINMNAFRLLTEKEGISLAKFDKEVQDNPLGFIPRVLYWGAVNYLQRGGKTIKGLPSFDVWAAFICEDSETFAAYAEKVTAVFAPPEGAEEPGN